MRETSDLVIEMRAEAKNAWLVAIALGFENETKFVFSSSTHPLEDLNKFIKIGGAPIGLLRFEKENTAIQGSYRPFEEYVNEPWVAGYLAGLLENTDGIISESQYQHNVPDY